MAAASPRSRARRRSHAGASLSRPLAAKARGEKASSQALAALPSMPQEQSHDHVRNMTTTSEMTLK
jgi:hypothetical protein